MRTEHAPRDDPLRDDVAFTDGGPEGAARVGPVGRAPCVVVAFSGQTARAWRD